MANLKQVSCQDRACRVLVETSPQIQKAEKVASSYVLIGNKLLPNDEWGNTAIDEILSGFNILTEEETKACKQNNIID